jgi:hypothetical protein
MLDMEKQTSDHLANLIAKGEVHPPLGPRVLPLPLILQPADKTAAEWVEEGRR